MSVERIETLAGLRTIRVTVGTPALSVVMLHGRAMDPEALAPFAHSLGVGAEYFVPQGPLRLAPGHAWWPIEPAGAAGARDMSALTPSGAGEARARLIELLACVRAIHPERRVVVIGFSQGGMLACDALLRDHAAIDALALLSSSRISAEDWEARRDGLRGLPVLVSHGRADAELAFTAGEGLRDLCTRGGATVTWVPFDGGHEIPLVAWRGIRRFLRALT